MRGLTAFLRRWKLSERKLELFIVLFGAFLRLTMIWNYQPHWAFDTDGHWEYIDYILKHGHIPASDEFFESFHPPLFYVIAAECVRHGFSRETLPWISVGFGIARLFVIWAGLEVLLPSSRIARVSALALAATLAASVHLDGMMYPEPLNGLLSAIAMLLGALTFLQSGGKRYWLAAATGLVLGVGMLTKISVAGVVGGVFGAAGLELLLSTRPLVERVKRCVPWCLGLGLCLLTCGWYYVQNVERYHKPFVTSFDLWTQRYLVEESNKLPALERRPLGFFLGWSLEPYGTPHRPAALSTDSRFFPVAVNSAVVDYWGYGFQGHEVAFGSGDREARPEWEVYDSSRLAMLGGTLVFFAMLVAWCVAAVKSIRQRDFARVSLLLIPLLGLFGALEFATVFPVDDYGVVKAMYLMNIAPPLYALFGLAVAWAARTPTRWPVLGTLLVALLLIANYTLSCRIGLPLLVN